jgi:hypothetical protein
MVVEGAPKGLGNATGQPINLLGQVSGRTERQKTVGLYLRVSTDEQSVENQRRELKTLPSGGAGASSPSSLMAGSQELAAETSAPPSATSSRKISASSERSLVCRMIDLAFNGPMPRRGNRQHQREAYRVELTGASCHCARNQAMRPILVL